MLDHEARLNRFVEYINDAELPEIPLAISLWKGETYLRQHILAAPSDLNEFIPGIEIRAMQQIIARTVLEKTEADAYLISSEGTMVKPSTGETHHVVALYYQSLDGPTLHRLYEAVHEAGHLRTGEPLTDRMPEMRGGMTDLFIPPEQEIPPALKELITAFLNEEPET